MSRTGRPRLSEEMLRQQARDRLARNYTVTETGCWEWNGCRSVRGYGKTTYLRKCVEVHRVSYDIFVGPIPPKMLVCHHCDNPSCINPNHLFLGTARDNMLDMSAKNRGYFNHLDRAGERNGNAKLSSGDVAQIRHLKSLGHRVEVLATQFNVSTSLIWQIARGVVWAHLDSEAG